jgi:hypothetical protein
MPQDRPDIMARVYRAKLRDLQDFLLKKHHLGKVAAWAHVTEFQKRGLPHEHFLLIMEDESKVRTPDDYDKYISAEPNADSISEQLGLGQFILAAASWYVGFWSH